MNLRKRIAALTITLILSTVAFQTTYAYTNGVVLKQGLRSQDVSDLQNDLKQLGYFAVEPTGYFGTITKSSVASFQKAYGLTVDGVAGAKTIGKLTSLLSADKPISRGGISRVDAIGTKNVQKLPWYGEVENIYARGDVATVIDVETGMKMQIKRTYGGNHADVETLTKEDTNILKKAVGGVWNWTRRPVIVEIDGYRIAGSMTAMPHAGRDDKPATVVVDNRSGGYGTGNNLDAVKGNGMDGQFDIHFLNSRTHSTNKVDTKHQDAIKRAFESGM